MRLHPPGPRRQKEKYKVGQKLNRITITKKEWDRKNRSLKYHYTCECGRSSTAWGSRISKIQSCGCHVLEMRATGFKEISGTYWTAIKNGAYGRNLEFNLSIEEAWGLFEAQNRRCALSGLDLTFSGNGRGRQTASLDRKDSRLGYLPTNVQWVHKTLNRMKGAMSDEEFVSFCRAVAYWDSKKRRPNARRRA